MKELLDLAMALADLGWAVVCILLVILGIVGLLRKVWAPYWVVRDRDARIASLEQENRAWREMALRGQDRNRSPFSFTGPPYDQDH